MDAALEPKILSSLTGDAAPATVAPATAAVVESMPVAAPEPAWIAEIRRELRECVRESGGPVSARARAAALGERYLAMTMEDRTRFLALLACAFGPDPRSIARAHRAYAKALGTSGQWQAEVDLKQAVISPRAKLLRQFNELPDGLKFLVDLRADTLRAIDARPELCVLDRELLTRLTSWFDVGFLELRRITWDSPAALLEKLIDYEAVHQIRSWTDLKNRLDSDRRCYAFFHPRMPREPLTFVEVALTREISRDIQSLLDESAPLLDADQADTAIFYSISNTQSGLRGVSFGNFLLKRVIEALQRDLPRLGTFCTLSPLPTFRHWLDERLTGGSLPLERTDLAPLAEATGGHAGPAELRHTLQQRRWSESPALVEALRAPMTKLCVHYLLDVKRGRLPLDPVARFHLGNGARIERLDWVADVSAKGFNQSYSMMVNYRYLPDRIEENIDRYAGEGHIAVGPEFPRVDR